MSSLVSSSTPWNGLGGFKDEERGDAKVKEDHETNLQWWKNGSCEEAKTITQGGDELLVVG